MTATPAPEPVSTEIAVLAPPAPVPSATPPAPPAAAVGLGDLGALVAETAQSDRPPLERDERYRPHVPPGAPDLLHRRLASWLVPTLVATAQRLTAAGEAVTPPAAQPSVALAVLGAVWAPRVDAATTARVVERFRQDHPDGAGPAELVEAVRAAGGDAAWARLSATSHRTLPSVDAPLKATAAREAAQVLLDHGLRSAEDLVDLLEAARAVPSAAGQDPDEPDEPEDLGHDPSLRAARDRWDGVRAAWRAVPGQASGRSWHRLLVLAGADRVVPDDDVRRYVSRWRRSLHLGLLGSGEPVRASTAPDVWVAARLLETAGDLAHLPARVVDHLAWREELLRGVGRRADAGRVPPGRPGVEPLRPGRR